jgi:hypothetical protein
MPTMRFRIALSALVFLDVTAAITLTTQPARAEDAPAAKAPPRANQIQLDLGLAVVGVAFEHLFDRHFALQLETQAFGTWFRQPHYSGGGVQVRPTIFPFGEGPRGIYFAPFLRVDRVSASNDSGVKGYGTGFSAGGFAGYSFLLLDTFNIRLGAGAQYMSYSLKAGGVPIDLKTPYPALDLVVGWLP